jgi:ABC-type multidrug transport system fused ATPase/permease subunit
VSDVTLTIPRMQTTALVGPSGVGKTTLADLVLRMHDPVSGRVLINGQDLRRYTQSSWHKRLAVVEQEPFLLHDTVLNNIRYGKPDASEEEVRRAAALAHADIFIDRLPAGYDTVVGQRGMALSGGQRQRIAMARALIRKPDLLVLDEATSALDSESERLIKDAIEGLRRQCTMIIIAHRLSTIAGADNIVILEGGRVIEQGTHAALIARAGLYARYHALQTEQPDMPEIAP